MGVVYLAEDPLLNRQVAVKTVDLAVDDAQEREFLRDRLLRDARAAALLKHPHIVGVHDVFEDAGRAYVVMEYVEGDTLAARLKANPLPDAALTLGVLRQMAEALDYTHSRGVIHRDIKPANVMIDASGAAKIMDFGIARITDTRTCTPTGMVMGTVEYMAPEQILGETTDGRADQFALAVVAYQMMTGSTLFGPNTMATLTYKIVNESPPPPCARNIALPRGVDAVLAKALAKKPAERFGSCREFVDALQHAFSDRTITLYGMPPVVPPRDLPPKKRWHMAVPLTAVVLLGAGGALAIWKPWNRGPQTVPVTDARPAPVPPVATPGPTAGGPARTAATSPPNANAATADVTPPKATLPPVASRPAEPVEPVEEAELLLATPPKSGTNATPFELAMQRGHEQLKSKDYPGAIQSFTKAIELRPNAVNAYYSRGVAQQNLEHNELAIQNYSEAIRLNPAMAVAYGSRGVCLVRLHRDPEALIDFQRALELKPDLASALRGRGGISFRRKQYRMALADFDAAIKSNPRFAPAYLNRARVREALGDLRGANDDRRHEAAMHQQ